MPTYKNMSLLLPDADQELRPYFAAAAQGKLVLKRCTGCGLLRYPPGTGCPWCSTMEHDWAEVSGKGTIYSYEIVTQAIQPGFREWVPYAVVLVELDEQRGVPTEHEALRLITNLVTPAFTPEPEEQVAIGKRVRVVFQPLDDDLALPQFTLSDEPAEGRVWQYGQ